MGEYDEKCEFCGDTISTSHSRDGAAIVHYLIHIIEKLENIEKALKKPASQEGE